MARVPVANPYRFKGSPSTTSTASTAKAAKSADDRAETWTEEDQACAHEQGWGVFEIYDGRRLFFEIQLFGVLFDNDGFARRFVADREKACDALAIKAMRIVFRSKAAAPPRKKK